MNVTLPASPATDQILYLYTTNRAANIINNGKTINAAGTTVTDVDFHAFGKDSLIMLYAGSAWYVIGGL